VTDRHPVDPPRVDAEFRSSLVGWFRRAARDLPWRSTRDPYAIWVSEVMLQQTRVETVRPYYEKFLARFPTVQSLAAASIDDVRTVWSGLGYYRRAQMLHAGARIVVERHDGTLPGRVDALERLPGIGAYTAGAIASIAYGQRCGLVDGNVERVLTRVFEIAGDPVSPSVRARLWSLAHAVADCDAPGDVNQALMELGATVCAPASPDCLLCPVRTRCGAYATGQTETFPQRPARKTVRREAWSTLVAIDPSSGRVWLDADERGRWPGMLLPPIVRARRGVGSRSIARAHELRVRGSRAAGTLTHVLTHAAMHIKVLVAELTELPAHGRLVHPDELAAFAVPKVTRSILERAGLLRLPGAASEIPPKRPPQRVAERHQRQ